MLFLWQKRPPFSGQSFGISFILNGVLCVLFGLAILAAPELLAYIVAAFLIFIGMSLVLMGWRMRKW